MVSRSVEEGPKYWRLVCRAVSRLEGIRRKRHRKVGDISLSTVIASRNDFYPQLKGHRPLVTICTVILIVEPSESRTRQSETEKEFLRAMIDGKARHTAKLFAGSSGAVRRSRTVWHHINTSPITEWSSDSLKTGWSRRA